MVRHTYCDDKLGFVQVNVKKYLENVTIRIKEVEDDQWSCVV